MALPRAVARMRSRTRGGAAGQIFQSFSRFREAAKGVSFLVRPRCAVFGPDCCWRALGIATRVAGAVFGDGRGRCPFGQHAHGARAHKMVREDRKAIGQRMRRQPHLSACRAGRRAVRVSQLRVNSQRQSNTHRTLRRALEHSADYAGPAAVRPQARTVGDPYRSSARDRNTTPARSRAAIQQSRLRIISQRYV
jgi:hypothetical protein